MSRHYPAVSRRRVLAGAGALATLGAPAVLRAEAPAASLIPERNRAPAR